jgi:hypothetical protein
VIALQYALEIVHYRGVVTERRSSAAQQDRDRIALVEYAALKWSRPPVAKVGQGCHGALTYQETKLAKSDSP